MQAANKHISNAIVQAGVAGALRNLAIDEANRKLIVDAGGITTLDAAATMHKDNQRVQGEITGAKRNLMGEAPPKAPYVPLAIVPPVKGLGGGAQAQALAQRLAKANEELVRERERRRASHIK